MNLKLLLWMLRFHIHKSKLQSTICMDFPTKNLSFIGDFDGFWNIPLPPPPHLPIPQCRRLGPSAAAAPGAPGAGSAAAPAASRPGQLRNVEAMIKLGGSVVINYEYNS